MKEFFSLHNNVEKEKVISYEDFSQNIRPENVTDITGLPNQASIKKIAEILKKSYGQVALEYQTMQDNIRLMQKSPQISGYIESEKVIFSSTFGAAEPTYLELLGQEEIQKIQSLEQPKFLLVGSYGKYSAQEFHTFAKKLNSQADIFVVDIDTQNISHYKKAQKEKDITFVIADGGKAPFGKESFDVICTNNLFHFMVDGLKDESEINEKIHKFLENLHDLLGEKGSILLNETWPKNKTSGAKSGLEIRTLFAEILRGSSLDLNTEMKYTPEYTYALRSDIASAHIQEDATIDYNNAKIVKNDNRLSVRITNS